jgi:hypothetical protein
VKLTEPHKLAILGVVGLGAAVLAIMALSGTASAATNAGTGTSLSPTDGGRGQAATALAAAIQAAGGYKGTEASLVVAYETAAGLTVDAGYPGTNVMTALRTDLAAMGNASTYPIVGTLALYRWTAAGGWASGNVPPAFADGSGAAWSAGTAVGT